MINAHICRDGAKGLLGGRRHWFTRLRCIWADGAYAGFLETWVALLRRYRPVRLEIVKRAARAQGFVVLPKRWIVERTFAWVGKYRRLSKDYEYHTAASEAMIYVAMIHIMVRRIARKTLTRSSENPAKDALGDLLKDLPRKKSQFKPGELKDVIL
jgi:putative transposase